MTTSEKVAYLKGLAEGLAVDANTPEGKLFNAIIDVLEDIALDLEDINENAYDLAEEIDEISADLAEVEDIVYEDYDEDEDEDDEDFDDEDFEYDGEMYDVECPYCNAEITVDGDVLECGAMKCPECGDVFTLDYEEEAEDEEDEEDED